jgi:DNA-binding transcriptional LysR family regulator
MDMPAHRLLTSREIDLLLAVGTSASFSEAAEALNLTQSGVSRGVTKVESLLGAKLFTRGKSGCVPTSEWIRLQPRLRRARQALDALSSACGRGTPEQPRGKIRIAGFRSAISVLLPGTIAALISKYPHVQFSLQTVREVAGGVGRAVLDGLADFGVTSVRPPRPLRSVPLGGDYYVAVRCKHARHRSIPKRECLVLWKERCSECVPEILKANGWSPLETISVDSDLAAMAMVEQDAGFAILPKLATEPLPAGLERVPLTVAFPRDIWLCGRSDVWNTTIGLILRRKIVKDVSARLE